MTTETLNKGLGLMRAEFPVSQISKLPKPTKAQTDAVKADFTAGIRCDVCGGWHHPKVVHLDYVGHAALTNRLLECDLNWSWEPVGVNENGLPLLDNIGGLWIKLTVCGVTRLGYGSSDGKQGGNAIKEAIGDALRNAAMRFGAALDLWCKGDLHAEDTDEHKKEVDDLDDAPKAYEQTEDEKRIINDIVHLIHCGDGEHVVDSTFDEYREDMNDFGDASCHDPINQKIKEMKLVWSAGNQAQNIIYKLGKIEDSLYMFNYMLKELYKIDSLPLVEAYWDRWSYKVSALDCKQLNADKHKKDGKTPHERMQNLYNHKIKELS